MSDGQCGFRPLSCSLTEDLSCGGNRATVLVSPKLRRSRTNPKRFCCAASCMPRDPSASEAHVIHPDCICSAYPPWRWIRLTCNGHTPVCACSLDSKVHYIHFVHDMGKHVSSRWKNVQHVVQLSQSPFARQHDAVSENISKTVLCPSLSSAGSDTPTGRPGRLSPSPAVHSRQCAAAPNHTEFIHRVNGAQGHTSFRKFD